MEPLPMPDQQPRPQPPFLTTSRLLRERTDSALSMLRRAIEIWPYVFIAVSITGLVYLAVNGAR